jgi:hypothetical protein
VGNLLRPICFVRGHKPDRTRTWWDELDWRAPCQVCGASMVRSQRSGWRLFRATDFAPEREGRDTYRKRRAVQLADRKTMHPDAAVAVWSRMIVTVFGAPLEAPDESPVGRDAEPEAFFTRLGEALASNAAFADAVERGALTDAACAAIDQAAVDILRSPSALPDQTFDQVATFIFARAVASRRSIRAAAETRPANPKFRSPQVEPVSDPAPQPADGTLRV